MTNKRKKSSHQLLYKIVMFCLDEEVNSSITKKQMVRYLGRRYQVTEIPSKNELQNNTKSIPS